MRDDFLSLSEWVEQQIDPLRDAPLVIVRDPQRLIRPGDYILNGWGEQNGFTVLLCQRNLYLREVYERDIRFDPDARLLLVDRSRPDSTIPLFYPDLEARAGAKGKLILRLRAYLVAATNDPGWPVLVEESNIARLIVADPVAVFAAHRQLRQVDSTRFTDDDLYKIVLGAALGINPFLKDLPPTQLRQVCVERHDAVRQLAEVLPGAAMDALRNMIKRAPKPFRWLLERDPASIVRAFTLAAILHQHDLDYRRLLPALDPALHDYRDIDEAFLHDALDDQMKVYPDRVVEDVRDAEQFLAEDKSRLAEILQASLSLDKRESAFLTLQRERLSPLIRSLALAALLCNLLMMQEDDIIEFHQGVLGLLDEQAKTPERLPRSPSPEWEAVEAAYRRAFTIYALAARLLNIERKLKVKKPEELTFEEFHKLWNERHANRLDYYIADLERKLRVGEISRLKPNFWDELQQNYEHAEGHFRQTATDIKALLASIDARFQDFYHLNYETLIRDTNAPMVFTHQFLPRVLARHWDPKSAQKAVILVFDGMRTDAWDELVRPVFLERFTVIEEYSGSAILPTETQLSRKAISAGELPESFMKQRSQRESVLLESWLSAHMHVKPSFRVINDDEQVKTGISVRYESKEIDYIVFNFTDKNLHEADDLARFYNSTVRDLIREDVRSVLHQLPENAVVFITSDHGFTAVPKDMVQIPQSIIVDPEDVKYRNARVTGRMPPPDDKHILAFDVKKMGIPPLSDAVRDQKISGILFPRPGYSLKRPNRGHKPDPYTHGGLSMAECLVPMVVMGPKLKHKTALSIQTLRQIGSISEGETLTIEIVIASTELIPEDRVITLSFSRDEIPTQVEPFGGSSSATYRTNWQPKLDNLTEEDRQNGELRQSVTVILSYRQGQELVRVSRGIEVRIKLDPAKLHRRVDSKLDLLMGKIPKGLK